MTRSLTGTVKTAVLGSAVFAVLSGCSFSPYAIPFPGGADLGDHPYSVTVNFRDVLDLVPQSAVRVNDVAVGKVTGIKLHGWTAAVTLKINDDAKLPDNAVATIRQTSLLGEKFVSLAAPPTGAIGHLGNGDVIGLDRSGRNPEIEEVLGAASLLFNGGGLEKTQTVVRELNKTLAGKEPEIRELLTTANTFVSQLDVNKEKILTALDKVNHLAVATTKQKAAITGALDELPGALNVVNQQRGDLVKLLKALDHLGDVGTTVVESSKADTLADIKALVPVLTQLANSGDDLATSLTTLLTFPFTDGSVGGTTVQGAKDFQQGDYFNLSVGIDMSLCQLGSIVGATDIDLSGLLGSTAKDPGCPAPAGAGQPASTMTTPPPALTGVATDPAGSLAALVGGLVSPTAPKGPTAPPQPPTQSAPADPQLPRLCSLFGSCRVAPANIAQATLTDLARLLIEPMVAS